MEGDVQTGKERDNRELEQKRGFNQRFWHVRMIDIVSETYRCNWDEACHLNVYEFLNVYSYFIAKQRTEQAIMKAEYDRIRAKHGRH